MTDHDQIRKLHSEHLKSYRQSAEYAEYAKETGYPVPDGPLPSLIGKRWEIDKDTYWEFLEVLPPLAHRDASFYLSEFTFGDITTKYTREGDRYYCEFARYQPKRQQPVETPWGFPDTVREIAPGIIRYDTPSHGGYWLSDARVAAMPKPLRDFVPFGGAQAGPGRWFEEDCDWSVVCLAFPQFFPPDAIPQALKTLQHYKPELYQQVAEQNRWAIYYASREFAKEQGDPCLGVVNADTKEQAEEIAAITGEIVSKAVAGSGLWAVRMKEPAEGRGRGA